MNKNACRYTVMLLNWVYNRVGTFGCVALDGYLYERYNCFVIWISFNCVWLMFSGKTFCRGWLYAPTKLQSQLVLIKFVRTQNSVNFIWLVQSNLKIIYFYVHFKRFFVHRYSLHKLIWFLQKCQLLNDPYHPNVWRCWNVTFDHLNVSINGLQ